MIFKVLKVIKESYWDYHDLRCSYRKFNLQKSCKFHKVLQLHEICVINMKNIHLLFFSLLVFETYKLSSTLKIALWFAYNLLSSINTLTNDSVYDYDAVKWKFRLLTSKKAREILFIASTFRINQIRGKRHVW